MIEVRCAEAARRGKAELEAQIEADVRALEAGFKAGAIGIEAIDVRPRKADTTIGVVASAWVPVE